MNEIISEIFPKRSQFWDGAILGTIATSMWLLAHPDYDYTLFWNGLNYHRQDEQGTRGTITFLKDQLVCAMRDDESPRDPHTSKLNYNTNDYFVGIPETLMTIANTQTLRYLFDEYEGEVKPIITAAFWSKGDYITAGEPWPQVYKHGAHIFRMELMPVETAIYEWQGEYELSDEHTELALSLYMRRMNEKNLPIVLNEEEKDIFLGEKTIGIDKSRELLEIIGITGF